MSSKYGNVLDGFNCNKYPCIIYFWNPQVKCSLMVVMPDIMMTIRMNRMIRNVLQVWECPWWFLLICQHFPFPPLSKVSHPTPPVNTPTGSDSRHHDDHQEDQDDQECLQECPPTMGMILMAIIATNTHVSYIFGIMRQNVVEV